MYSFPHSVTNIFILDTYTNVYSLYLDQSQNASTSRDGNADKNKPKASFPYLYDVISEREIEDKINHLKDNVKNFKIRYKVLLTYSLTYSRTHSLPLICSHYTPRQRY